KARYEGSDRQLRGRVMAALRDAHARVAESELLALHDDEERMSRVLESLERDGLISRVRDHFALGACGLDTRACEPRCSISARVRRGQSAEAAESADAASKSRGFT